MAKRMEILCIDHEIQKWRKAHFLYDYKVPLNTITEKFTNLGLSGIYYKVIPLPASTQHATTYFDNKTKTMNKH